MSRGGADLVHSKYVAVTTSLLARPYGQQGHPRMRISQELFKPLRTCFHRVFPVLVTSECYVGGGTGNHGGAGKPWQLQNTAV